jgi:hypothetical protein
MCVSPAAVAVVLHAGVSEDNWRSGESLSCALYYCHRVSTQLQLNNNNLTE